MTVETESPLARLRAFGSQHAADVLLLENPVTVRWATGYDGHNGQLLVTEDMTIFCTDPRYSFWRDYLPGGVVFEDQRRVAAVLRDFDGATIAFEDNFATWKTMQDRIDDANAMFVPVGPELAQLRARKTAAEIATLREACSATVSMMQHVQTLLRPGKSERDIAREIAMFASWHGDGPAFAPTVATGVHTANPHHRPTDAVIEEGHLVTIDAGVKVAGMHADMTRTFPVGQIPTKLADMHRLVDKVADAARRRLKAGTVGEDHDAAARAELTEAGHGEHFTTGLGHGVGYEVHEAPMLVRRSRDTVAPTMAVTIEPGVYVHGVGGVRIEDTLLVTDGAPEILTPMPRSLADLA